MDLLDYRTLRSGGLYRVRRSFTDHNARLHRVGEEWTYIGYREEDEAVVFLVRGSSGEQRSVPLVSSPTNGAVGARDLPRLLGSRFEIPEEQRVWCGCGVGEAAWSEALRTHTEVVRYCSNCHMVVVLQPTHGGYRLIALDDKARDNVVQAALVPANVPLPTLLGAASTRQTYPANLLLGHLLAERMDLNWELSDTLQRGRPDEILLTLEFVAQLAHIPEPLDPWLVQLALCATLGAEDDLVGWSYEALRKVVERLATAGSELEPLAELLVDNGRGKLSAIPEDLLMRLDERARRNLEERDAASAVLRRLADAAKWDEAVDWLNNWAVKYPEPQRLPSRALLAEEAADTLGATSDRAAHWLYEYALALYDHAFALRSGNDGLDEHYSVERLRHKLHNLADHTKKARSERHAALSTLRSYVNAGQFDEAAAVIDEWEHSHPGGHALLVRAQLAEEAADGLIEHNKAAASWLFEWARAMFEEHAKAYAKDEESAAKSRHVRRVRQKLTSLTVFWKEG